MPALGHVYWRGFLRLQLVSINIDLYSAVDSKSEITFNQIHKPTGKRIKYEKVVPGVGPVDNSDIVKGYQVEPDVYVTLEPEEVESLKLESKKTIDLVGRHMRANGIFSELDEAVWIPCHLSLIHI